MTSVENREIKAFVGRLDCRKKRSWANFQPILDCFVPKFKLESDGLENIKADRVNAVVFDLH